VTDHAAPVVLRLSAGDKLRPEETERLTAALFAELGQLPDIAVARPQAEAPPGTKSGAAAQSAELLVSFLSGGGMTGLVAALKVWTSRDKGRSAELHLLSGESLTISGATRQQQDRFIDKVLGRGDSERDA
jgi:hypothetical protein